MAVEKKRDTNACNWIAGKGALPVLSLCLLAVFCLGGCVKKYVRSDIASYAKKRTGRDGLVVSEGYREIQEDEEGYLDHLWTVEDPGGGFSFHVLDDYYWALEEVENRLLDDYDSAAFLALLDKGAFPDTRGISLKKTEHSGLVQARLTCSFSDMAGLRTCYEELLQLRRAAAEAGFPDLQVPYTVKYKNPLRGRIDYDVDEGDTEGTLGSLDEAAYARMQRGYLSCALDYRFEGALAEFSAQEIAALVADPGTVRLYREGESPAHPSSAAPEAGADFAGTSAGASSADAPPGEASSGPDTSPAGAPAGEDGGGSRAYYEGVIGSPQYAGISFGTLYELLRLEGKKPEGSPWHYTFTGADGASYEVSYDFDDLSGFNDADGKLQKGYYYIRDGRKVRMPHYYDNHFEASQVLAMTGIPVAEDRPYLTE